MALSFSLKTIVCYGDLVADLVMQIPRLPILPDQAQLARSLVVEPGGAGNFLITAARLGGRCVALAAVGEDPNGETIHAIMQAENIDMGYAQRGAGSTNVIVIVFVDDAGQHVFIAHDGTGAPFAIGSREAELIREVGVFYMPGYSLAEGRMAPAALEAMHIAHKAGVAIMNDLGPVVNDGPVRDAAIEVVRHSHVSLLTAHEAMQFTGESNYESAANALLQMGSKAVVIKRGPQGCVVFDGASAREVPGLVVPARDTTAAGDSFAGGFVVDWLKHGDVFCAAQFANAVAAAKVQKIGSGRQCPTAAEVEAMLRAMSGESRVKTLDS